MPELFNKTYARPDLLRRLGNLHQIAGIREYTYNSGRADGVKAIEINTGPMQIEILPSRCLDIPRARYYGIPFGYLSKSDIRHPAFYAQNDARGFLGNFYAGVLTTCGLHNVGGPSELDGVRHEQHGEIPNIPADNVGVSEEWDGDDCWFTVTGEVHYSQFYACDLILRRTIRAKLGGASFTVEDEVENLDFAPSPCMLLYHSQCGYPILDAHTKLITSPIEKTGVRAGGTEADLKVFNSFAAPEDGKPEVCFLHTFKKAADGKVGACLFNSELSDHGLGYYVRYDQSTLPNFVQWKMLRSREYVCGLEPGNIGLDVRTAADIESVTLQPLEKRRFSLEFGVIEGEDNVRKHLNA